MEQQELFPKPPSKPAQLGGIDYSYDLTLLENIQKATGHIASTILSSQFSIDKPLEYGLQVTAAQAKMLVLVEIANIITEQESK